LLPGNHSRQLERDLHAAHRALDDMPPDIDRAIAKAEQALANPRITPVQAAEAHFFLGTAHMRRAEEVSPEIASASWELARSQFEEAEQQGLPEGYQPKLTYRLGKTYFMLQVEPQRVIDLLSRTMGAAADDAFEGYGLLAQAYLRLPKADVRAALDATLKQLASLPEIDEPKLAQPRLLCGELYRRLDQPEEARKVLARIGSDAPPDVLFQARYLRACTLQDGAFWQEAAQLWEELKGDPRAANVGLGRVQYLLGFCYRKLDKPAQAQKAWEEAIKSSGEEGQAAAVGLAELRLRGSSAASALEAFDVAVHNVNTAADYQNSLLGLNDARSVFDAGCRWYLQLNNHDAALHLAHLYERIALPGVAQELAGQAAEAWGRELLDRAKRAANNAAARKDEDEGRKHLRHAGSAFETAAGPAKTPQEQADLLWRSAKDYLDGHDAAHALPVLERFVTLPVSPEKLGEAWYIRAEALRSLRNDVAAQADYRHCIKFPGPFAYRARHQLAMAEIERKNLEEAESILNQNLEMLNTDAANRDPEAKEKTLFALAHLLVQRQDYRMAFVRLQEALEQYPNNPGELKTRFELGQCAMQLADDATRKGNEAKTAEERAHYRTQQQRFLEQAAGAYQRVVDECTNPQQSRVIAADAEMMVRDAAFAVAECRFSLGQYDEALRLYEGLAKHYRNQVEELIAWRHAWQCYGVKFQPDQAKRVLEQMRQSLQQMPASAFDNSTEVRRRRWWDDWLREKSRPSS
jgi:tetratricopeptide (TPR) repeat protein